MATKPTCLSLDNYGDPRSDHVHVGLDIIGSLGQEVYAVVDGTLGNKVVYDGTGTSGNAWRLRAAQGTTYYVYMHLDGFAPGLENGSAVRQGDVIGYVGNTGNNRPDNIHLHFEVHPLGTQSATVNPLTVITVPPECKP